MHLWTKPSTIVKDYIVPPEKLLYFTRCYTVWDIFTGIGLIFLALVLWALIIPTLVLDLFFWLAGPALFFAGLICLSFATTAFLRGFDNLFFVTTDKLIYTQRTSFFGREVDPTHLDNVASAQAIIHAASFGLLGTLNLALRQPEKNRQLISVQYVFAVDAVAAVVENAIDLMRNRMYSEKDIDDQQEQIQQIRTEAPAT